MNFRSSLTAQLICLGLAEIPLLVVTLLQMNSGMLCDHCSGDPFPFALFFITVLNLAMLANSAFLLRKPTLLRTRMELAGFALLIIASSIVAKVWYISLTPFFMSFDETAFFNFSARVIPLWVFGIAGAIALTREERGKEV